MNTGGKFLKSRFIAVSAVTVSLLGGMSSLLAMGTSVGTAGAVVTGGSYTAVSPTRLADTRTGTAYQDAGQHIGPGQSDVVSLAASVPSTATAVVLNVTGVNATQDTYLSVYPNGDTNYTSFSNVNVYVGVTQPNLVTVPIGTSQSIDVYNFAGTIDAVVDLEGYFSPSGNSGTGHFNPLVPARITDTRSGSGQANAGHTLGTGSTLNVQVTGQGGVPASGVSAVELNVTATDTTGASYFTVYPNGVAQPVASNLNWLPGETIPNRVIVPVGTNGQINIYNLYGNADAVVDVDGWFSDATGSSSAGDVFTPVTPARISDTRSGSTYPNAGSTLSSGGTETVQVAGAGGVPTEGAATVTAAVLNVTVATDTAPSYLTVYPADAPARPNASDLNFFNNFVVANADMAQLSAGGAVNIYNFAGNTDVVVDVMGYFTPAIPSGYESAVAASPSTVVANGTASSSVEAQVENNGAAVAGDVVTFSESPSVTGSCGTLASTTETTAATGITPPDNYTASTTAGACTITETEASGSTHSTAVITQTPATTYTVVATSNPSTVTVSTGTSEVQAAVGQNGSGVNNAVVTFTLLPSVSGSCGTLAQATETTGVSGATPNDLYTASATVGTCTITATTPGTQSTGITVISQQPAATVYATAVVATPSTVTADGASTSTVVAAVDKNSAPFAGDTVNFTLTPTVTGSCGTLAASSEVTGANGETPADTYTSSTTAGACTVTATEVSGGSTAGQSITQVSNRLVAVTASPQSVTTGGTSEVAAAVSAGGAPISADVITFSESPSVTGSCGTLASATETTNGSGVTPNDLYTASATVGSCTVTATDSQGAANSVVIGQTAPTATTLTITANPSTLALVSATSTITVTTTGAGGVAVPNQAITFALSSSGLLAPCGSLNETSGATNGSGVLTVTYTAPAVVGTAGTCTITATDHSTIPNISSAVGISELLEL